jgi:hypothetical protein
MGSYHRVSRKYLLLYVAEFQFRYNNRENPDIFAKLCWDADTLSSVFRLWFECASAQGHAIYVNLGDAPGYLNS